MRARALALKLRLRIGVVRKLPAILNIIEDCEKLATLQACNLIYN